MFLDLSWQKSLYSLMENVKHKGSDAAQGMGMSKEPPAGAQGWEGGKSPGASDVINNNRGLVNSRRCVPSLF